MYLYRIYHVCMFWYFKHNSACGSLKHGQQFDAQNSNQRKKSKKKKEQKYAAYNFPVHVRHYKTY